jgi:hypothetical protein
MAIGWKVGVRRGCESRSQSLTQGVWRTRRAKNASTPLRLPRIFVPHAIVTDLLGGVGDQELAADGPGAKYGEDGKVEKVRSHGIPEPF